MAIRLKTPAEIEKIKKSGQAAAEVLQALGEAVRRGISTLELDEISRGLIAELGGLPSFLGYGPAGHPPYPATICASINEEIVHGIPDRKRTLSEGDILGIDVAVNVDGYHGDNAFTFPVGQISSEAQSLLDATRASLNCAIDAAKPGNRLGDVGFAVQRCAEDKGFSVIRDLFGHGIGQNMWEEPQVFNFGTPGRGTRLRPGMVLAIEPMLSSGTHEVRFLDDGWTSVTADGSLSAHFEHTVAILSDGPEILTANDGLWG